MLLNCCIKFTASENTIDPKVKIIKTEPTAPITCELGLSSFALVCFLIYELVLVLSTVRIDLSSVNISCSISSVKFPPPKPHGHRKEHATVDSDVILLIIVVVDNKSVVVELEYVVESKSVAVVSGKHVSIKVDIFEEVGGSLS